MTAKHVFRRLWRVARWLLVVVIKFLFVFWLIAVEPFVNLIRFFGKFAIDYAIDWPGVRWVIDYLSQWVEIFDDWLRARSNKFVMWTIGTFFVIGVALNFYKAWLGWHDEVRLLLYVEVLEKCTGALLFKHLLHVYHDRLLSHWFGRIVYDQGMTIRAKAVEWVASNRYSKLALAWRAALQHRCCVFPLAT